MIFNDEISNAFLSILDECDTSFKGRLSCAPRTDEDTEFLKTFFDKLGIKYTISTGYTSTMHGEQDGKQIFIIEEADKQPESSWNTLSEIFNTIQPQLNKRRQTLILMAQDFRNTTKQQEFEKATDKIQTQIMAQRLYLNSLAKDKQ